MNEFIKHHDALGKHQTEAFSQQGSVTPSMNEFIKHHDALGKPLLGVSRAALQGSSMPSDLEPEAELFALSKCGGRG
jgi:hypothetical protein